MPNYQHYTFWSVELVEIEQHEGHRVLWSAKFSNKEAAYETATKLAERWDAEIATPQKTVSMKDYLVNYYVFIYDDYIAVQEEASEDVEDLLYTPRRVKR